MAQKITATSIQNFVQDLVEATTSYDSNYLGRETIFKGLKTSGMDDEHDINVIKIQNDIENPYQTIQNIVAEDQNGYKIIVQIETPEQFVRIMNYQIDGQTQGSIKDLTVIVKIKNNLYFQNDWLYKNGLTNSLRVLSSNITKYTFIVEPDDSVEVDEVIIQGVQITDDSSRFIWLNPNNTSASAALNYQLNFNHIYFKDCVCTKTQDDTFPTSAGVSIYCPICSYTSASTNFDKNIRITFTECKISMHIRASEHGYSLNSNNVKYDTCSIYIEYSDLYNNNCPALEYNTDHPLYKGLFVNSSIIIRNLAIRLAPSSDTSSGSSPILFGNNAQIAENCAWDIEIYDFFIDNSNIGSTRDYFSYSKSGSTTSPIYDPPKMLHAKCRNNFVSIKVKKLRVKDNNFVEDTNGIWYKAGFGYVYNTSSYSTDGGKKYIKGTLYNTTYEAGEIFDKPIFDFGRLSGTGTYYGADGVNVFNTGDNSNEWVKFAYTDFIDGAHYTSLAHWHPNVKLLTETECKNPAVLNKWGFFVNQDYQYVKISTKPIDWDSTYWTTYYYYDPDLRVYKNIPKGVAPDFTPNKFYKKVVRS